MIGRIEQDFLLLVPKNIDVVVREHVSCRPIGEAANRDSWPWLKGGGKVKGIGVDCFWGGL